MRPLEIDLSSRESIERAWSEHGEELGRVDVLVNNAGEFAGGRLERIELDQLYTTVQANLTGLMHLTQRVLPGMLERGEGKIVNQASIMGYAQFPGTSVYAATKAGVTAFTECLRRGKSQFARLAAKGPTGLMDAVTKRAFDR